MPDDLRDQLADAIMSSYGDASAEQLADALLPVVRAHTARALRDAAADWPPTWAADPATYLRDRADAIEAGN